MMFVRRHLAAAAIIFLRCGPSSLTVESATVVEFPKEELPNVASSVSRTLRAKNRQPSPISTSEMRSLPCNPNDVKTEEDLERAILAAAASPGGGSFEICNTNPIQISRPLSLYLSSDITVVVNCLTVEYCGLTPVAGYSGWFLTLSGGGTLRLFGLSFRNFVGMMSAGVLAINRSSLIIDSCYFDSNKAISGGCIASYGGSLTTRESTFENNNATVNGGAVLVADGGVAELVDTTFFHNFAYSGGAVAFVNGGTARIDNCYFVGNHASYEGGGIWQNQSSTLKEVHFSKFLGNGANIAGGAFATVDSKIVLANYNMFYSNSAPVGGAGFVAKQVGNASVDTDATDKFADNVAGTCPNVWIYDTKSCKPSTMVTSDE